MIEHQSDHEETFEDFKNSFSYGDRSDMNFKFIKNLSVDEAASFFEGLLRKLGTSFDDGSIDRLIDHAYEWQVRAYAGPAKFTYDTAPFVPLRTSLSESKVVLLATSGHFVEGDDPEPFGVKLMTQAEAVARVDDFVKGAPTLSSIPIDTPPNQLRVRHAGYDVSGAELDPNVTFPYERLHELAQDGVIGEFVAEAYSFMGTCSQLRLLNREGPAWVEMLQEQDVDAALLVPV